MHEGNILTNRLNYSKFPPKTIIPVVFNIFPKLNV